MASDTNEGSGTSPFHVQTWKAAGFLACLLNGKLGRFSYYQAQAVLECGPSFNTRWFREGNSAFGMHVSEYTPRADQAGVPGDAGVMAVYTSSLSAWFFPLTWIGTYVACYRSWKDRFYWDDTFVDQGELTVDEWAQDVAAHGYKGGRNATPQEREDYAQAIIRVYNNSGAVSQKFLDDTAGPAGKFMRIAVALLILALVLWILWKILEMIGATRRLFRNAGVGRKKVRKSKK